MSNESITIYQTQSSNIEIATGILVPTYIGDKLPINNSNFIISEITFNNPSNMINFKETNMKNQYNKIKLLFN